MTRGERYHFVLDYFSKHNPDADTELLYESPYQLLVSVILSAQCTDKRVNMTTPAIFDKYPDAATMAKANFDDLFPFIRSISYPNNKTKHLIGMAQMLVHDFGGKVPLTVEELVRLPGVGRKTANVVLGNAFAKNVGVVVDTHVARLSARFGLTRETDPKKIEPVLMKLVPQDDWTLFSHWLIFHGRRRCKAQRPDCPNCEITNLCPSYEKFMKLYAKK